LGRKGEGWRSRSGQQGCWRPAPHWFTVEWLPKYAPKLNDIEVVWHDLKAFNLATRRLPIVDTLDAAIHNAVADLNAERNRDLLGEQRISA
jgi:transposase